MTRNFSFRRIAFALWLASFPCFFIFWYYPVISFQVRLCTAAMLAVMLIGAVMVAWPGKSWRWAICTLLLLVSGFLLLPAKLPADHSALRDHYVEALKSYTGRPYVWGGEGWFGIDCSGFVRKSMEDAMALQGLTTLNPALIRASSDLYWNDTTAKVIGQGYNGRTRVVTTCSSLNEVDPAQLQPGDMAVTRNGVHVLAYLGNKEWIAADPEEGKVAVFTIPEKQNAYFSTPMTIVRWSVLTDSPEKH